MTADLLAEGLEEHARRPLGDLVLFGELGVAVDEHEQLVDARDPRELADVRLERPQQVEDHQLGGLLGRRHVEIAPDLAEVVIFTVAVADRART